MRTTAAAVLDQVEESITLPTSPSLSYPLSVPISTPMSPSRYEQVAHALRRGRYLPLSQICGVDRRNISRILNGITGAHMDTFIKIADAANVTLDELREYIESKKRSG